MWGERARRTRAAPEGALLLLLACSVLCEGLIAAESSCPRIVGVATTEGAPNVFKAYIDGEWRASASGKTLKVLSPVNETVLFEVQVR